MRSFECCAAGCGPLWTLAGCGPKVITLMRPASSGLNQAGWAPRWLSRQARKGNELQESKSERSMGWSISLISHAMHRVMWFCCSAVQTAVPPPPELTAAWQREALAASPEGLPAVRTSFPTRIDLVSALIMINPFYTTGRQYQSSKKAVGDSSDNALINDTTPPCRRSCWLPWAVSRASVGCVCSAAFKQH